MPSDPRGDRGGDPARSPGLEVALYRNMVAETSTTVDNRPDNAGNGPPSMRMAGWASQYTRSSRDINPALFQVYSSCSISVKVWNRLQKSLAVVECLGGQRPSRIFAEQSPSSVKFQSPAMMVVALPGAGKFLLTASSSSLVFLYRSMGPANRCTPTMTSRPVGARSSTLSARPGAMTTHEAALHFEHMSLDTAIAMPAAVEEYPAE